MDSSPSSQGGTRLLAMKKRVYEILEAASPGDRTSRAIDLFLITLISLNVLALVIGTVDEAYRTAPGLFLWFERASMLVFTVEYLLRVWACTEDPKYSGSKAGRLRFLVSPFMVIDLIVILPFFVLLGLNLSGLDLRFFRAIRLAARVSRLTRYYHGFRNLRMAVAARTSELTTVLVVLGVLLVVAASLMFYAEQDAQPDKFSSIPAAMWWSIITLTTVGYGDVSPVTGPGKVIAGFIAILGIGLFAVPAGILGSAFLEQIERRNRSAVTICPHCGEEITGE